MFFVPIASYFLDFQTVLGVTAIFHLSSNLTKIAFFRKGVDRKLLIYLGIPAIVLVVIGAWLSNRVSGSALEIGLYLFLIALSLLFLGVQRLEIKPNKINSVLGGGISGFLAGLIGTGGAVRGITMAAFNLPKEVFIATSAFIDLGIDLSRTVVYVNNGFVHDHDLYLIPLLLVVSIVGTWIGKKLLDRIPQSRFRTMVLILILLIGLISLVRLYVAWA